MNNTTPKFEQNHLTTNNGGAADMNLVATQAAEQKLLLQTYDRHPILLTRGEKEKITNVHVAALASICRDLKIIAYVKDNDGKVKVIKIVE